MRIVALADTHTFEQDLGSLPEGDVFLHAGDLLAGGSLTELRPVAAWILALPHPHKIVIAGNHDWCFARWKDVAVDLLGPDVTYLEDSGVTIDGTHLWGSPWQPEFCDWAFNLPRGELIARKWELIPDNVDILITHGPPRGFGDRVRPGLHEGCDDLLDAVRRIEPALHLFGHIHEDGGCWRDGETCFANVNTCEGHRPPTVIDYDPETRTVTDVFLAT